MPKLDPNVQWVALSETQKKRVAKRHYNGTCICYGRLGAILPGSRETGRDCIVSRLTGPYWTSARKFMTLE